MNPEPKMSRMVSCVKFGREMEGLDKPPLRNEFGQKLFDKVSKEAWKMWVEHSKMLVNEYRLDLTSEQGQKVWIAECEKFFFGEGSQLPPDFVPSAAGGHGHDHDHDDHDHGGHGGHGHGHKH